MQGSGEVIASGAPNATSVLRDADGNLVEGTPTPGTPGSVCFASGTLITTEQGDLTVDDLAPGMRVLTKDHGYVTLRAIRKAPISKTVLRWNPDVRAIVVPSGVLGNSSPLRLSPAHRILMCGGTAELLFSTQEVLVSARQLVGYAGIYVDKSDKNITYFHLLFDDHEIVQSNGIWTESLFLGDAANVAILAATGWRVEPGLDLKQMTHLRTARLVLKGYEASLLACELAEAEANLAVA